MSLLLVLSMCHHKWVGTNDVDMLRNLGWTSPPRKNSEAEMSRNGNFLSGNLKELACELSDQFAKIFVQKM